MKNPIFIWTLKIIVVVILFQTLFFKFSASEESVFIFSSLGMEPWGRIGTGMGELIAGLLILWPRTSVWGACLTAMLMVGALGSHLFVLGIQVMNDGGLLFALALITFLASMIILISEWPRIAKLLNL